MENVQNIEKEISEFWKAKSIYEKSKKKNAKGPKFYMMDGPPYANGKIHLGTALNKILKDIAMRSKRLQGYDVFDRPGYDTHGVPIEFQIEKEIGSKNKKDIEKYGVKNFIEKCKEYVARHVSSMNQEFSSLGIWMDWDNPYTTLSDDYMENIWGTFKEAEKKGLLYLGKYPVHVCPRCETAVAYNEIEYGKQKDNSIFVKFKLKKIKNTYLIIWTTTPWTLPANTGVMVNPEFIYQEIELSNGEKWIIAKELVPKIMGVLERGYTPKKEYKGKDMEGWEYESPLEKYINFKGKNSYKVVLSARYVNLEDGTGLVHCAPGHGKEDYEVGKEYSLDMPSPVEADGRMSDEAGKYKGKKAREVDPEIIADLKKDENLVYLMSYEHDYPLCWRDKSPLIMISMPQWFFKISEIKNKLIEDNEKTNWNPSWMNLRMKTWLESIGDWPVSRQRYWGTPIPIWYNEKTGDKIVVGSISELKKLSGKKNIGMHKPEIDEIEIERNGVKLKRVKEVLDVWFDSGVSSWAALNYNSDSKKFKEFWPADLNIEGKDQVRGWWNSQMILSEIKFGKKPFKSILVHGMILDISKRKMSKSVGNAISPKEIIDKYGRDYMRYYFAKHYKGDDFAFNENEIKDLSKIFMMISNINNFVNQTERDKGSIKYEDEWIISKYNNLIKDMTLLYEEYKFPEAVQRFEDFIFNDLSRTYIKMIRERSDEVYDTLNEIRIGLIKLIAPVIPFVTEKIWLELYSQNIVEEESIHLSNFPKTNSKKIDNKLEINFNHASKIIELGLAERDKSKIGLRWPLAKAKVYFNKPINKNIKEIIARQLNVKKIEVLKSEEVKVELDSEINEELEAEGFSREVARKIQSERKKAGMKKTDLIKINIYCDKVCSKYFHKWKEFLKSRTNSSELNIFPEEKYESNGFLFTIKEKKISASFY